MNRKVYKVEDFNEWTAVDRRGIMALPGSPSVSDWLESEFNAQRIRKKQYPIRAQFKMYDHCGNWLYRFSDSPNKEKQPDICEFCGRFEPCVNVFGNMFCEDTPTCALFKFMSDGRLSLLRNLTSEHVFTLDLIRQSNLDRLPNKWREWAERQIAINDYHKGEL